MKYMLAYFVLYIFRAADGLKKTYQLLIGLNEIHTVIPDILVLQIVVVEQAKILPTILKRKTPM